MGKLKFKPYQKLKRGIKNSVKQKGLKNFIINTIMVFLIIGASLCLVFALYIIISSPNFDKEKLYTKEATIVYDVKGKELARIGSENRELITYEDLPQVFIDALIATEDSRFFQHNGLDIARFIKATAENFTSSKAGGASTITMQLVKNLYTKGQNKESKIESFLRKFRDIYMAVFKLENCYTKEEIMEFYVNSLWLGNDGSVNYDGIYGVETGSQYYFGKSVSELSLAESSLLVGMYQNALWYNPYTRPEECKKRQTTVLKLMVLHGYITEEEQEAALAIPIESLLVKDGYLNKSNENRAVLDYIINEVIDRTGVDPRKEPMQIYSTIDTDVQKVMTALENGELFKFYTDMDQEGVAVTSMENGSIVALSPGRNYKARGLNRAVDINNQPGSTAKPLFDYAPYIEYLNGSTGDYFFDEPYTYSDGTGIGNSDNKHDGLVTLRYGLYNSKNIPALQAFQRVAKKDKSLISNFVKSVGINYGADLFESASIGGFNGMSPLESSAAFAVFGRGGYYIEPYSVTKIVYPDGTDYEYKYERKQVLSEETAYMITSVLLDVTSKTTDALSVKGTHVAGKTGTTNIDDKTRKDMNLPKDIIPDTWFTSYSPEYSISLWYGYDKLSSDKYMNTLTGWKARREIMQALASRIYSTNKTFKKPSGVIEVEIEKDTIPLMLPTAYTPENMRIRELFKDGTEPTEYSFRYEKLESPTNGKNMVNSDLLTITWDKIATPKAIDSAYLQKYFDENYDKFASKYYEKRIKSNAEEFGDLGYDIYSEDDAGNLQYIGFYTNNTYTQTVDNSKKHTFVIKAAYRNFKANASDGLKIVVNPIEIPVFNNEDDEDITENNHNNDNKRHNKKDDKSLD